MSRVFFPLNLNSGSLNPYLNNLTAVFNRRIFGSPVCDTEYTKVVEAEYFLKTCFGGFFVRIRVLIFNISKRFLGHVF